MNRTGSNYKNVTRLNCYSFVLYKNSVGIINRVENLAGCVPVSLKTKFVSVVIKSDTSDKRIFDIFMYAVKIWMELVGLIIRVIKI